MKVERKIVRDVTEIDCLIIREPYASLIVFGKKRWEFRNYDTRKRGVIGIAASRSAPMVTSNRALNALSHKMSRGVVIGTAELINSFYVTNADLEFSRGEPIEIEVWGKKIITLDEPIGEPVEQVDQAISNNKWEKFGWIFDNVKALDKPIEYERSKGSTWTKINL